MRILKFAKTDLLKQKQFWWMLLFPAMAVFMGLRDAGIYFAVVYCVFVGIIVSVIPFSAEAKQESGFLGMLPSKPGELILGHCAFGFFTIVVFFLEGLLAGGVILLLRPEGRTVLSDLPQVLGFCGIIFACGLFITGVQEVFWSLFRFQNPQVMALLRMLPGFLFFFLGSSFFGDMETISTSSISQALMRANGPAAALAGIAVYILLSLLASRVARDR